MKSQKTGYNIKCANEDCDKMIYVIKSTYENSEYKLFSCCRACQNSKNVVARRIDIFEKIHGVRNKGGSPESLEKIKQTNLKKFGTINPFQNEDVKKKIQETNLKKYGTKYAMQNTEIAKKSYDTLVKNNGGKENMMGWCPKEIYKEKCLEHYGVEHFFQSVEGKQDLKSLILTHGEERGTLLFEELGKKKAITLENMVKKYGEEEGLIKYNDWKDKCKHTLENFILRHGEDGIEKYDEYILKKVIQGNNSTLGRYSKISIDLFDNVIDKLHLDKNEVLYKNDEFFILNTDTTDKRRVFLYDFKYKNKLIEFMGDFFHGNKELYSENDIINIFGTEYAIKDLWEKDRVKKEVAINLGFDYLAIWEKDYRNNKENIIQQCCDFILS